MADADRDLVFGLLTLQNGLIDQDAFLAAFRAWTLDRSRPLADQLVARGDLEPDDRSAVEALVVRHLKKHGGDAERSMAAVRSAGSALASLDGRAEATGLEATLSWMGANLGTAGEGGAAVVRPSTPPDAVGGRYRVVRPHAKGGIGLVSVALDSELHREVALKEIQPQLADDPASRARFLLEAEVTGRLEHPGVVPVYGLSVGPGGRPYYAMRFVRGESLKEAVARCRGGEADPLEFRRLLRRFLDVCNAVAYAHSRGVIHRDIKPANILLGPYGETLLVDWGLAKVVGRDEPGGTDEATLRPAATGSGTTETQAGSAVGTPAYMCPEQADGRIEAIGPASDVYGLGATLYFLLTGRAPHEAGDVLTTLMRVRRGEFPPPRQVDPAVPRPLEAIVLRAMALDPAGRYPSARDLADDVEHWLADERVSAYREPWTDGLVRWLTRHRTGVTAAAAAGLALVIGLAAVAAVQARGRAALADKNAELGLAHARVTRVNSELEAANAEVSRQRDLARSNFRQARRAVDDYLTRVSEDVLLKEPGMQGLRKQLLGSALEYYRDFAARRSDDPDLRAAVAEALERVGQITGDLGDPAESEAAWREAGAIWESLERASPDEPSYTVGRSRVIRSVAGLLDRPAELTAALALIEPLAARHPDDEVVLRELASLYHEIGRSARSTRAGVTGAEELSNYRKALAINELFAGRRPDEQELQAELASCLMSIGFYFARLGETDEAIAHHGRARDILGRLVAALPPGSDPELRRTLGRVHLNIGFAKLLARGDAEEDFERALEIYEEVARDNPAVLGYQLAVPNILNTYISLLNDIGKFRAVAERARSGIEMVLRIERDHPGHGSRELEYAQFSLVGHLTYSLAMDDRLSEALGLYRSVQDPLWLDARAEPGTVEDRLGRNSLLDLNNLCVCERDLGLLTAVLEHSELAAARAAAMLSESPEEDDLHRQWALAQGFAADALERMGRTEESIGRRRAVLAAARARAAEPPDSPTRRADAANAALDLADALGRVGEPAEAEAVYREALAIGRASADADPADSEVRKALARGHSEFGRLLLGLGRLDEAIGHTDRAVALYRELADRSPDEPGPRLDLAPAVFQAGVARLRAGRPPEGEVELRRAVALHERLAADFPEHEGYAASLWTVWHDAGADLARHLGPEAALPWFDRAIAACRADLDADPDHRPALKVLATSLRKRASALGRLGRLAEAEATAREGLAVRERIRAGDPEDPNIRIDLADDLDALSLLLLRADRPSEALAEAERAVALRRAVEREGRILPANRPGLANSLRLRGLARLGLDDAAGAAADTRDALDLYEGLPTRDLWQRFDTACCLATLAVLAGVDGSGVPADAADTHAERALALLREATRLGLLNLTLYRAEPALDPLRGRDDFRLLLLDVAFPAEPFARGR